MPKSHSRENSFKIYPGKYQKYEYTPLDPSPNSIRLLRLQRARDSSWPIRCTLFHTTLEDAPPYVALSCTWGDPLGSQLILVDSETIFATRNLLHALLRLRQEYGEEDLVLWIDAICINQQDIPERNFQTANMRAIYQHAASVAVWLGPENSGSSTAIQLARDLNVAFQEKKSFPYLTSPN